MPFAPSEAGGAGTVTAPSLRRPTRRVGRWLVVVALAVSVVALVVWIRAHRPDATVAADAATYVALALAFGRIDASAVDSYFGPAGLASPTDRPGLTLAQIRVRAARLLTRIVDDGPGLRSVRWQLLATDVRQLIRLIDALQAAAPLRFDDEARQLYGVEIGAIDDRPRRETLARIAALLPGRGPLAARVAAFRTRIAVPEARRAAVFARALEECRRRTLRHWPLPRDEGVDVRWSADVPAAWHRYLGGDRSTLEINPAAVAVTGAAIDVACHEAYPGHHAQFVAMAAAAGAAGVPLEDHVVLLRTAASVLREGAANYGVRLAFPPAERAAFTRDVLYPLAGLPPRDAATDTELHLLLGDLELSVVPILRAYRDGALPFAAAAAALRDDALIASPEALLRFVDRYGALVVGYTIARDRVAAAVARRSARSHRDAWAELHTIVATADVAALALPATVQPEGKE